MSSVVVPGLVFSAASDAAPPARPAAGAGARESHRFSRVEVEVVELLLRLVSIRPRRCARSGRARAAERGAGTAPLQSRSGWSAARVAGGGGGCRGKGGSHRVARFPARGQGRLEALLGNPKQVLVLFDVHAKPLRGGQRARHVTDAPAHAPMQRRQKKSASRPSARPQARADGRAGGCAPWQTHGPRLSWAGSSRRSARQAGPQVNNVYTTCTRKSTSKRRARRNEGGALGAPTCSSSTTLSSCGPACGRPAMRGASPARGVASQRACARASWAVRRSLLSLSAHGHAVWAKK